MADYLFYPPADAAQDAIWNYTCTTWGEAQAETYIRGLHDHLQVLADRKKPWRELPNSLIVPPDLNISAYFSRYEHHYVFFRELADGRIGVMSILHEKMHMPVRLVRDLRLIEEKHGE